MTTMDLSPQLKSTLQQVFGFPEFRHGQEEAITTLLTKGSVLCILPTGYGKSLLYQLPACMLDGITLVISPLLALMRDQIDQLNNRFKIPAMAINSDQSDEENFYARQAALKGEIKILFVAPEQLDHIDRFDFLLNLNVKLVVVDEAHCISIWGHDFRPSYRQIIQFLRAANNKDKNIKVLGLTATANQRVEEDINNQLFLAGQKAVVLRQTMNRPNIHLSVIKSKGIATKLAGCEELINRLQGCGLIYCATRENTELVADYLTHRGLNVAAYHAGFENHEKRLLQVQFITDKYKALVATNALGMGIDKGNVRFIIHFDFPSSITSYYQEVGRCGRDGKQAEGIMLYDPADKTIQEYFIFSAMPTSDDFQSVIKAVSQAPIHPSITDIKTITGLHPTRVNIIVAELLEQGFLSKSSINGKQVYQWLTGGKPDLSRYSTQRQVKFQELNQIINYGDQVQHCRMSLLRSTLGDELVDNCGHCDACLKTFKTISTTTEQMIAINIWLNGRPLPIAPMVKEKVLEGASVLDGKLRSPLFIRFMKERANCPPDTLGMDDELLYLLKLHISKLSRKIKIGGIVLLPSRTWQARDNVAEELARHLNVPLFKKMLYWSEMPHKRQGELLNNDQRKHNVQGHMSVNIQGKIPNGALVLFDDYIGSGNTIREAARAIRNTKLIQNELVPFTVAALKWHLGKLGFA